MLPLRSLLASAALAVIALGAGACGSSTGTPTGGSAGALQPLSFFQQRVDRLFAGDSFSAPAGNAPKPQPGKKVWAITFGLAASAGAEFATGAKEGGEAVGWKVTVFDGKFDPNNYLTGIRQAIAAKADGIILYAIDCPDVKAALQEAKNANIPVIGIEDFDCSELKPGEASLFASGIGDYNAEPFSSGTHSYESWIQDNGRTAADAAVVATGGKAKVIDFVETDTHATILIDTGFKSELSGCGGCTIVGRVEFTGGDIGTTLQDKAAQALLQHPDANAIFTNYDAPATGGISAAVVASGRVNQIYVVGGEGDPPNVQLVRENRGQNAGAADPVRWEGYAGIDALNRVFNGQKAAANGIGMLLWDKTHNLPPSGEAVIYPIDYRAAYLKSWAVVP